MLLTRPAKHPAVKLYLKVNSSFDLTPINLLQNSYDEKTIEFTTGTDTRGGTTPL